MDLTTNGVVITDAIRCVNKKMIPLSNIEKKLMQNREEEDRRGTAAVVYTEAVRMENRGSILSDFVAGKSPMAFEASILIHFIHKSALYFSALLKSSIVSL
jgi:hypothetical protein